MTHRFSLFQELCWKGARFAFLSRTLVFTKIELAKYERRLFPTMINGAGMSSTNVTNDDATEQL